MTVGRALSSVFFFVRRAVANMVTYQTDSNASPEFSDLGRESSRLLQRSLRLICPSWANKWYVAGKFACIGSRFLTTAQFHCKSHVLCLLYDSEKA